MSTVYRYKPSSVTPTAGLWSGNTLKILGSLCHQIYVKATTGTTTFNLSIIDPDSISIRKFTNITGTLNDLTPFPMSGINTVEISSASADEAFTVLVCVME
jgi:hypothetical protein